MAKDFDAIVCGSCVVDVLVRPVDLERPIGGGKLIQAEPLELTTGGIVANSGITLTRLGMRAAAFSYVGNDAWAEVIRQRYAAEGLSRCGAAHASDRRHEHDGRADRPQRRAVVPALRRGAEAA
jgi:sugar/nucleoside kinase (ribokinase family)